MFAKLGESSMWRGRSSVEELLTELTNAWVFEHNKLIRVLGESKSAARRKLMGELGDTVQAIFDFNNEFDFDRQHFTRTGELVRNFSKLAPVIATATVEYEVTRNAFGFPEAEYNLNKPKALYEKLSDAVGSVTPSHLIVHGHRITVFDILLPEYNKEFRSICAPLNTPYDSYFATSEPAVLRAYRDAAIALNESSAYLAASEAHFARTTDQSRFERAELEYYLDQLDVISMLSVMDG